MIVTAINPLTGEREAISLSVSAADARALADKARAGGMYKDIIITDNSNMDNDKSKALPQVPGALPQASANGLQVDIDRTAFALALRTWRVRHMLTQSELGARWGVSRYTIIKAERGKYIAWEMAYRLFVALSKEMVNDSLV